jgi:hypothetical protein
MKTLQNTRQKCFIREDKFKKLSDFLGLGFFPKRRTKEDILEQI